MDHLEIRAWLDEHDRTLLAPNAKIENVPPGWDALLARACIAHHRGEWARRPEDAPKLVIEQIRVREGELQIWTAPAYAGDRGRIDAVAMLSGETCEICGSKGDPVEDGSGLRGTRCARCRLPDQHVRARAWAPASAADHPQVTSPGQWSADIRGPLTGEWDARDWRNYGRLETTYAEPIALLMQATDDAQAMRFWAGGAGWAGLLRGLFITLRPEQDERPDDPEHTPWRLRWMKEKWGELNVRTTRTTTYQRAATWVIERMSARTCIHCGAPGGRRIGLWVRPECDACWASAPARDHEWAQRWDRKGE